MSPDNTQPGNQQPTPPEAPIGAQPQPQPAVVAASTPQPEQAPAFEQQQPFVASTPVGVTQPVASAPVAQPSIPVERKRGVGIIVAAIVGLIGLGVVAFLVITTAGQPTKKDYIEAVDQFAIVSSANKALSSDASTAINTVATSTDSDFDKNIENLDKSIANIKEENDKLGKLRASNYGEGGELYKAFNNKLVSYIALSKDLRQSLVSVRPAMVICSDTTSTSDADARTSIFKKCSDAIGRVENVPLKPFSDYISVLKAKYIELADIIETISKISNPYASDSYDGYKALLNKVYGIQDDVSAASKAYHEGIDKLENESSPEETAIAFSRYIQSQANKK